MVYSETSVIISEFTKQHGIKKTTALHLCATNVTGQLLACFVVIFTYIYVFWSFTKNSVKTRVKFGGTLSQTKLWPRLSNKVFRLLPYCCESSLLTEDARSRGVLGVMGRRKEGRLLFIVLLPITPRALFGHAVSSSDFRRAIQIRLGLTVKPKLVENTAYKSHKKIYDVNNGLLVYRGTGHNLLFWEQIVTE